MIDCVKPYYLKDYDILVRCGRCALCRLHQRREWNLRLWLEATCHKESCFITLTYDDDHCPTTLQIRDFQLFMKRLRKAYKKPLRYFTAGEYGDTFHRPHFHQILFGFPWKDRDYVANAWHNGFVDVSPLTPDRCNYTCGYVQKKLGYKDLKDYTDERPPFSCSSKRPAIGLSWYEKNKIWLKDANFIAYKGERYPLPRYYKELLFQEYPEYKERLITLMQDLDSKEIERLGLTYDDFILYKLNVSRQKACDLIRKNELYLCKKRSKYYANKVL